MDATPADPASEPELPLGTEGQGSRSVKPASGPKKRRSRIQPTDGSAMRDNPLVPTDWMTQPIFTIRPIENREPVTVRFTNREWRFGVPNPAGLPSRPMTLAHAAVLFTVLGVYQEENKLLDIEQGALGVQLSLREIARRVSTYQDQALRKDILLKLDDLKNTWCEYDHEVGVFENGQPVMVNGKIATQMATDTFSLLSDYATRKIWQAPWQPRVDPKNKDYVDLDAWRAKNGMRIEDEPELTWTREDRLRAPKPRFELKRVVLAHEFITLAREITRWIHVRMDQYRELRSDIARAVYLYIPSRAAFRTAENPWRISLTKLLTQIGEPVPPIPSLRRKIFVQNGTTVADTVIDGRMSRSILAQLDGRAMAGGIFRCRLEKNAAETDYLFVCWRDDMVLKTAHEFRIYEDAIVRLDSDKPSKLLVAWLSAGRTRDEYMRRVSPPPALESHEAEWLEEASINTATTVLFFRMAKALIGEVHFHSLLREAVQEQHATNATGLLISRVLRAVESLPAPKKA